MFTKKSHQDVKKSSVKIQDSKKDSATRLKHLKIVLEHYDNDEAKLYFETHYSHVYFILYDNFLQAENNLRQRVHKAGREELEGALSLLEKVLCLLPELLAQRWQLHSLTRIFSKLLHHGNSYKLRAEAVRYFLLWYQALGDNAPIEVHCMFATLVPGLPEPRILPNGSLAKQFDAMGNIPQESAEINIAEIMQHPNFQATDNSTSKKTALPEQPAPTGFMGRLANVSASIFHDTNVLNPVQSVDIHPLLPATANEKNTENETVYFLEILLNGMATSVTRIHWKDRSHNKAMRNFAFLLEKFKTYYLPFICPQFDHNNSLYTPNLDVPVQHTILEDDYVQCRVTVIKWVIHYVHSNKRPHPTAITTEHTSGQPSSMTSVVSQNSAAGSANSGTPGSSMQHEEETSFTMGASSNEGRTSSQDTSSTTPHQSLDSVSQTEEISSFAVARDVFYCSRDHVNFVVEVLRQAFILPFSQSECIWNVIMVYKDWIQVNITDGPPFLLENTSELCNSTPGSNNNSLNVPEVPVPAPRRLRTDSYLGAIHKDNLMIRAGLQKVTQVFMTQAANVFVASASPIAPAGSRPQMLRLLERQTDTCKRVLNIYRYMVMRTHMEADTWEQLLMVLLQITSLVLTKAPPKGKHESLGGSLAPAIFQTLLVTWIKANLNVAVKNELWQTFMDVLGRLTHWEDLIKEWAKTMEILTRLLARHVYQLDLSDLPSEKASTSTDGGRRAARRGTGVTGAGTGARGGGAMPGAGESVTTPILAHAATGKSPKNLEGRKRLGSGSSARRHMVRCRSDPHLSLTRGLALPQEIAHEDVKELTPNKPRRYHSLDSLRNSNSSEERDGSESGTRSPSPAPSSGVESSSIKDSPLQIDLVSDSGNGEWSETETTCNITSSDPHGVLFGGTARGWLPDVAAVMWRRMLAALGDPNHLKEPALHVNLYQYLLHLSDTLVKISENQSLNNNAQIHVPLNLFAGWSLAAEALPLTHRQGKLRALRLLCNATQNTFPTGPHSCNNRLHLAHLQLYHRALHHGLTGEDRSVVDVLIKNAAPRYLSLALDGYSLLLLDFVHASTIVLNSSDIGPNCPRSEAVTFLGSLLSLPDNLMNAHMLQPYAQQYTTVDCPDLKEHVLNIVVRICRREPSALARCGGALALAHYCYHQLAARTHCLRLPDYVANLLQMLTMKNKNIAKVVSDCILMLADYTDRIMEFYPGLAGSIVRGICACLAQMAGLSSRDSVRPLAGSLLLCLAEFAVRMGTAPLLHKHKGTEDTLLLTVFKVLYAVMRGTNGSDIEGPSLPLDEDFDPNVQLDNMGPKTQSVSIIDVKLWAQMICSQLVQCLGHWPLTSACQISSSVCEQHDSQPSLGAELGPAVLSAPHIQLLRLAPSTLASFVELPALDMPGGGVTPGLVTSDRQVRVILRDLAGKSCWDASALYYDPQVGADNVSAPDPVPTVTTLPSERDAILSSLPPPYPQDQLPEYNNVPPDKHQLDHLLQYIGHTSPEVLQHNGQRLDSPAPSPLPTLPTTGTEDEVIALIISHRNSQQDYLNKVGPAHAHTEAPSPSDTWQSLESGAGSAGGDISPFQQCRLFLSQFGVLSSSRRKAVQLMNRSDRLIRELKNLDLQRCRETHKVALIYVGRGQESRNDILSNRCGSPAYEAFLAALAWEVELESHVGFTGGLQRGGPGGVTAPYVATLTLEALFHVATRMPSHTPEAILNKTRHLGNDEVHVVWSEHWRAYRRDTLPTQFCDVLIALYPLPGGLLRCTLTRKADVPMFGPLPEECVIPLVSAAGLVRAAVVSASRAVRSTMALYQHAYSERARSLDAASTQHAERATYERFVERVLEPVPRELTLNQNVTSGGSVLTQQMVQNYVQSQGNRNDQGNSALAAALLDHTSTHPQPAWTLNSNAQHGVSPRPVKRLGPFKRPVHPPSHLPADTTPPHTPNVSHTTQPPQPPRRNR